MQLRGEVRGKGWIALMMAALLAGWMVTGAPDDAHAQRKGKTKQFTGRFEGFDPATNTITVKKGRTEEVFNVKPEGSVLTRSTVKINGMGAKMTDLPPGAPVIVYWIPDENDKQQKFARSIDAPSIPEDLLEEFGNE